MRVRRVPGSVVLLVVAVEGCYLAHERELGASCTAEPVASCATWEAAGAAVMLSAPAGPTVLVQLADALALDCDVLVSWNEGASRPGTLEVQTLTRVVSFDGTPRAATEAHPALTHASPTWSGLQLAESDARVSGLAELDGRCVLLSMDTRGVERGPSVEVGRGASCRGLAAGAATTSFVRSATDGGGAIELVTLDAEGRERSRAPLPVSGGTWWSRSVFDDGSFLSYSFSEDLATTTYEGYFRRFDARGAPLAEETSLGESGVPVHVAETARGALATWMTAASGGQPVRLRPIDLDGRARGETRDVPAEGALYGLAIQSTPDGGALLAWAEWHHEDDRWLLRVQSLDADGGALGPPTIVRDAGHADAWELVLDASGRRALLVLSRDTRAVEAQPLRCRE